jgi:hypothetical protein
MAGAVNPAGAKMSKQAAIKEVRDMIASDTDLAVLRYVAWHWNYDRKVENPGDADAIISLLRRAKPE